MSLGEVKSFWLGLCVAALVYFFAGVVGHGDFSDEVKAEKEYCQNVANGVWPDYRKLFKEMCKTDVDVKDE